MKALFRRSGPLAAVLATVIWLSWESADSRPAPREAAAGSISRIEPKLLTPAVSPPNQRNPLRPVGPIPADAQDVGKKPQEAPSTVTKGTGVSSLTEHGGGRVTAALARTTNSAAPVVPTKVAKDLKLRGTSVSGQRKSALINKRLYFEGDRLPSPLDPGQTCTLTRVARDSVVLALADREMILTYEGVTVRARAGSAAQSSLPDAAQVFGTLGRLVTQLIPNSTPPVVSSASQPH